VLAERFAGTGGTVRWTNDLMVGGRTIGIQVENSDETTLTRYFHTDHLVRLDRGHHQRGGGGDGAALLRRL